MRLEARVVTEIQVAQAPTDSGDRSVSPSALTARCMPRCQGRRFRPRPPLRRAGIVTLTRPMPDGIIVGCARGTAFATDAFADSAAHPAKASP